MSEADPVSFADMDSRGFLLIRSFLDQEEIEMLHQDFEAAALEVNSNYSVRRISPAAMDRLEEKFRHVNEQVAACSSVRVDCLNDGVYFSTVSEKVTLSSSGKGAQQAFPWHQDHENYWMWHDVKNYLNFYMPVVKPVLEKSNLTVVPLDRLKERAPEIHDRLLGRGATRVLRSGKRWIVKDDDQGGKVGTLDFDLAEIEETPQLRPGDLLLLRGDIIHRTQDSSTRRVAASIRYINSETIVPRSTVAQGGLAKMLMMLNARYLFEPVFHCFDEANGEPVRARVIDEELKQIRARRLKGEEPQNTGKIGFLSRLVKEKIRCRLSSDKAAAR
ncbi:phytanoyl-CoA dioxygenase family protein [Aporhodopirellula aestuarii]|uniref:Phytanoyl-CoA dioxygenase family protein n=1 Tax=Aporhodopirellula aestuarii TaxID=2950107 RepID=A0ABT0U6U8_9BACT|nr:phytanoyl-CoA dioxygenase family protein [Aporhodopirellula aestuarii]MCM2372687.1 phytanoyl-CoA dioxygenase family protein [Aporhodopirellula aestuarii]